MSNTGMEQTASKEQNVGALLHSFGLGRRHALSIIDESRASGQWTERARAEWRKESYVGWKQMQHWHPDDCPLISSYAGFVAVLKSDQSLICSEQERCQRGGQVSSGRMPMD